MLRFFSRPKDAQEKMIISLHLPKCAGTSFTRTLHLVYGKRLFTDYGEDEDVSLPEEVKIVHGHFPLKKYLSRYPNSVRMTWLRHPVSRVISWYYYWLSVPEHGNPNHDAFLKHRPTLPEFASYDYVKTELTGYLEGFDYRAFDFVGIVEHYDRDLQRLAQFLKWEKDPGDLHQQLNEGPARPAISLDEWCQVEQHCVEELEVYYYWAAHNSRVSI